ncbi:hypothetical protein EON65_00015 [archaeon]|nr:MAG: hypothetical protein EON65_00015 [archaeon]
MVGELYYLNGTHIPALASMTIPYNTTTKSYAVRYRPPWDVSSSNTVTPLVIIRFTAIDGVTGETAGLDGLVRVVVKVSTHIL